MRGNLSYQILKRISEVALDTADVIAVLLNSPYGTSYQRLARNLEQRGTERQKKQWERAEKQRYYNILYRLEKEGFIEKTKERRFFITALGKTWLTSYNKKILPPAHYQATSNERWTIVAFDVPEKERRKRDWLRAVLHNLEFKMIQRSVWIGKIKLPRAFMTDLKKLNLLEAVEIFEITKTGTLKHVA